MKHSTEIEMKKILTYNINNVKAAYKKLEAHRKQIEEFAYNIGEPLEGEWWK